ncbi:MAG: PD-(D/E)XK nuclease family protein [bacterium]
MAEHSREFLTSASGAERRAAILEFLGRFRPGTEILLVGPTRDAVDDFVRDHAARTGATFGLHRYGLWQLVSTVAATELATEGLAPATQLGLEAVAARATHEAIERGQVSRLADVGASPGFAGALASSLGELRLAGLDIKRLADVRGLDELHALASIFERELESQRVADRAALLRLATWAWRRPHWATLRAAPLVLIDLHLATHRETELIEALVRTSPAVLATVPAGDRVTRDALKRAGLAERPRGRGSVAPTETSLERLRRWLFVTEEEPSSAVPDGSVRFLSAPGEARECVEIARGILDEARRGTRFDEIAVFVRAPEVYSAHLATAFRRAGIPSWFARGTQRPDPAGRAFLALLACCAERLSAKRFAEYLSFAQVPDPDPAGAPPTVEETPWVGPSEEEFGPAAVAAAGAQLSLFAPATSPAPAPPPSSAAAPAAAPPESHGSLRAPWKWEELLVEAAVIGGRDRWKRRLDGLAEELKRKLREAEGLDPESPRTRGVRRELENVGHLERFALPLIDALDALPASAPWGEWLDALKRLAPRALRRPERVLEVLDELAPMAGVGPVAIHEVRGVLTERLGTLEEERAEHRFGRVFVATPEGARGRVFRVVFVPGLAERIFPRRPREDPLLLDENRQELSAALRTQEERGAEERMLLRHAVGAASERLVLSYPRVEVAEGRPRVPSFYALDVARAQRGEIPDWEQLEREAETEASARLAWPAPHDASRAIDAAEHDLASIEPLLDAPVEDARGRARYLLELNDHLARALRSQWARWWRRWWPSDGIVRTTEETAPILATQRLSERAYSPTSLERYAACPYRFYLSAIQRLQPREDVAPIVQLDPLTKGSMVHEIQARTLRALRDDDRLPLVPEELEDARAMLDQQVDLVARTWRDELAPAIERVWEDEVADIRADLRVWLRGFVGSEWTPAHFELSFGLVEARGDPAAVAEDVRVDGGWRLRGAIDLVERRGSDLRVTDHKTGMVRVPEGSIVSGGESLQPLLYSLAATRMLDAPVVEARLSYCTARGGFVDRVVPVNEWTLLQAQQVLQRIDRAVQDGHLMPAPKRDACRWCDFRTVCGPHEEVRTARKDPALLEELRDLREQP